MVVARNDDLLSMLRQHDEAVAHFCRQDREGRRFAYDSIEGFVIANGQVYDHISPLAHSYKRGRLKACFWNSRVLASRTRGRLTYVEGYALSARVPIMPIHHAWNVDADGGVVDVTWWEPGLAYIGCPFPIEYVRYSQTNDNTSVLDQWQKGYPLLSRQDEYKRITGG